MNYHKTLSITKTTGEWETIQNKIELDGKRDLNGFLRSKVKKLIDDFKKCPHCITSAKGKRIEKRPHITIDQYQDLKPIARKMKLPVSKIIDKLIISPLLYE